MDGVAGKVSNALDTVRGILGGILPQLEGEHVDIVNRFLCGFLCLNKRTLQLNVLELELVEFLAHGGQFVCFAVFPPAMAEIMLSLSVLRNVLKFLRLSR